MEIKPFSEMSCSKVCKPFSEMSCSKVCRIGNTTVNNILVDASSSSELQQHLGGFLSSIICADTKKLVGLDIVKQHVVFDSTLDYQRHQGISTSTTTTTNNTSTPKFVERIALLKLFSKTTCLIIYLLNTDSSAPPFSLSKFLQLPEITFVGVGMKYCIEALGRDHGLNCRNAVDLCELGATIKNKKIIEAYGLIELAFELGVREWYQGNQMYSCINATLCEWNTVGIPSPKQMEAATWSCYLCFRCGSELFRSNC